MKYLPFIIAVLIALAATAIVSAQNSGSCNDPKGGTFCNSVSKDGCYCDSQCTKYGDCCKDYASVCATKPVCGDGVCAPQESCGSNCVPGQFCPQVCVVTCPEDCTKPVCGDGVCTAEEDQYDVCTTACQQGTSGPGCTCSKKCPQDCNKISETVTCKFIHDPVFSKSSVDIPAPPVDNCYTSTGPQCSGFGSCSTKVTGAKGTPVLWESSCGKVQVSTIDGQDETLYFDCSQKNQITKSDVMNWIQSHCDEPYYALTK